MRAASISVGLDGALDVVSGPVTSRTARLAVSVESLSTPLGFDVPDVVADLIGVASAVHAADRLVPRESGHWTRHLRIRLPVRRPERWMSAGVSAALEKVLAFLTEDLWEFEFVARNARRSRVQRVLPRPGSSRVALFSGGLDSLVGLATEAEWQREGTLHLVSLATSSRLLHRQKRLLKAALRHERLAIAPVVVPFRLHCRQPERACEENSQRTRGFLFGSVGAAVAELIGARSVSIFENGVGAINLPLTPAQLGAQSTRSCHPVALAKLGDFVSVLLEKDLQFDLPLLFLTKGESCRFLQQSKLRQLIGETVSCDSFPLRMKDIDHCGHCSSCLLRREALWTAGIAEDAKRYQLDLLKDGSASAGADSLPLKEMLWQVFRLRRALNCDDPWSALAVEFPALRETARQIALSSGRPIKMVRRELCRLYGRYCDEWSAFPVQGAELARAA